MTLPPGAAMHQQRADVRERGASR